MSATAAKGLFDSLQTEADLQALVDAKERESLYLEFKGKQDPTGPALHYNDGREFSKTLSGFANADGGILIWGILTKVTNEKIDYAEALKPISDVEAFCSRLSKSILNSTQPVVDDVLLEMIPSAHAPGSGYIRCWIPASEKVPHRAMLANREYWRRTSEGFYRLEHFDLEDMFGRRPRPALELSLDCLLVSEFPSYIVAMKFLLRNRGRGIARFPALTAAFPDSVKIERIEGRGMANETALNGGRASLSWAETDRVFHVSQTWGLLGTVWLSGPAPGSVISLGIEMFADRMMSRQLHVAIKLPPEG